MQRVVTELGNLRLDILDAVWVQGIYYSEFLEFGEFPPEYERILETLDIRRVFESIMHVVDRWLSSDEEDKSWAVLSPYVEHQKLLAILAYHIDQGTKNVLTKEYRNNALLASRLYFKFMAISGYKAYHIYHSQLFAQSLACLGYPKAMCDHEEGYFNTKELTKQVNSVIKELQPFVIDLKAIIGSLQLGPDDMNFEDIVSNLVDVCGGAIVNKLNVDRIEFSSITYTIYEIINTLIKGNNDGVPNPVVIKTVYKVILPKLVAASVDSKNANTLVRASYVTYLILLLGQYGKPALTSYTILLQHLCFTPDGLERAEVRAARVELVVGLMSMLPQQSHEKIVKWLVRLSNTSKVVHRQLALEVLSKLLSNEDKPEEELVQQAGQSSPQQSQSSEDSQPSENQARNEGDDKNAEGQGENRDGESANKEGEVKKDGESVNKEGEVNRDGESANKEGEVNKDGETTNREGEEVNREGESANKEGDTETKEAPAERVTSPKGPIIKIEPGTQPEPAIEPLDGENEAPHEDFVEIDLTQEEAAGLLRQRPPAVAHAALVRAVYERVADAASSLRARAFALLADCLRAHAHPLNNAIQELSGEGPVSRLLALAARGVCDERAVVRRAALSLVHRELAAAGPTAPPPDPQDLGILVGLCRDASILVRSAAIAAMGDLATSRPSDNVFDAFLSGPMHQLSDPETKIQEQVMKLIQEVLIDRLKPLNADYDPIPWQFLAAVARHNQRRHLQKACALLAKNSTCISIRVVDAVSTHLGAVDEARDLQALVLLTSVARHVDVGDVSFALDYYYARANDAQSGDPRLMALALELLTLWARWARGEARAALRDHLVLRLAAAHEDGCRLAAATLALQLDPTNLTWATEMLQIAERRALECWSVDEWIRAVDLSLVAPAPPSPALLRRFLAALSDPPLTWSEAEIGCAVAGVGRLCVRSRHAAADAAPALARTLHDPSKPLCARQNALLALTDICVRYTCIVEPLLGDVCECLSPSSEAPLRRTAARSLTRLLLAGYLRLRTPLYYRYCALLADEDPDVREPAEYYVTCCLTPDAIYHHFVDCVLHYNADTTEGEVISFDSRQLIYDVMLQRLSIVQRLNLQCRLAREILEHAADVTDEGDEELPPALNAALLDTITLLCGPRMKLPRKPVRDGEAADIDELHERVTTNIVSHKMKRTVAEVLVPAVLRLYARLGPRGGQVAAYLVRIANDLLNDYRQEIEELIDNDEELVQRVRQFQETIGLEPSFGNARNLVTASTAHEPDTPRAPRRRAPRHPREPPKKRALRV